MQRQRKFNHLNFPASVTKRLKWFSQLKGEKMHRYGKGMRERLPSLGGTYCLDLKNKLESFYECPYCEI